jgi:hypothetical protein
MPAIRHDDLMLRLVKEVNDIKAALRRIVPNLPLYDIANENTPAQLTADQNNYAPGNYDVLKLSSTLDVSITGVRGGVKGRSLKLYNIGAFSITLSHQNLSSDAANRFDFVNDIDFIIPPSGNALIYYDSAIQRWIGGDGASLYGMLNEVTPPQITSNQNNYDIGFADILRLSTDADRIITGLDGGVQGRSLKIFNIGSYAIILAHQNTASSASNRFKFSIITNVIIMPGSNIDLYYDVTQARWIDNAQLEDNRILKEKTSVTLTGDQNNFDPSDYSVILLSPDFATRTITGISGGVKGRLLKILNTGGFSIILSNENSSSSIFNRFSFSNAEDYWILPSSNVELYYDSNAGRWKHAGQWSTTSALCQVINSSAQTISNASVTTIDPGIIVKDQYGYYDDTANEIVFPMGGFQMINFFAQWDDTDPVSGNIRRLLIYENASLIVANTAPSFVGQFTEHEVNIVGFFRVGSRWNFKVYQESGGNLDLINTRITVFKIN